MSARPAPRYGARGEFSGAQPSEKGRGELRDQPPTARTRAPTTPLELVGARTMRTVAPT
ncbi:hypothetical protein BJY54_003667 [Streptomyces nodosus]|nr:hypothetical protein [Streptomyces nodosus]